MRYELAQNIKKLRLQKQSTQTQLAKKLGVVVSTIASYENQDRMPSIDMLVKLSYEFNVSIEYLLDISKNRTIDASDLTDKQIAVLNLTVEEFRNK